MLRDRNFTASGISSCCKNTMENNGWDRLPDDVQTLVFIRLPLLDLRRLSLTCKYFNSILSNPSFAVHYDRHRLSYSTLFAAPYTVEKRMLRKLEEKQKPLLDNLGESCWSLASYGDGLVCFAENIDHVKAKFLVFNPLYSHELRIFSLPALEKTVSALYTGIAFDRKNGVCKLVLWYRPEVLNSGITTLVYSFKESTWKKIPEWNGMRSSFCVHGYPQLVNERFLCWLVDTVGLVPPLRTVLVFDVEEESWKEKISLPSIGLDEMLFVCIGQYKKGLSMISQRFEKEKGSMILGLWKFHMDDRVWILSEYIPAPPFAFWYPVNGGREFWAFEHPNGEESDLWICDMSQNYWRNLGKFPKANLVEGSFFRIANYR